MIHVIGNAAIDTILQVERFPRPGETIVARALSEDLGGKGANQAIAIARCGAQVRLLAALGADAAGARIRRALEAEGVATHGLAAFGGPTDRCVITVDAAGENTIVSLIEAARAFDPAADGRLARTFQPGDWALLQGNLSPAATRAALALAKETGATTALNPSPTYASAEYDWSLVDLVVLNRSEALELGGREHPLEFGARVAGKRRGGGRAHARRRGRRPRHGGRRSAGRRARRGGGRHRRRGRRVLRRADRLARPRALLDRRLADRRRGRFGRCDPARRARVLSDAGRTGEAVFGSMRSLDP